MTDAEKVKPNTKYPCDTIPNEKLNWRAWEIKCRCEWKTGNMVRTRMERREM